MNLPYNLKWKGNGQKMEKNAKALENQIHVAFPL